MKTALVTGGAGFIWSHLCEQLLNRGKRGICVDNFFVGSEENISHLKINQNFKLIEHNIIEPLAITESIDWIFNLACPASPVHYQYDPVFTMETNVIGTKNMLELALKKNARILQASTSEVYGDPSVHPQPESYWGNVNCTGPRACYDEGKRAAETVCFDYHRERVADIRVIRIFNTYGPRMAVGDGRVVSNFVVQALQGNPLTVYGDGSNTRSFQYVDDLIRGILAMMEQDKIIGPVNLGNPNEFTVKQLAETVRDMVGVSDEIVFKPLPTDDPKQRQPDIALAREQLAWEPQVQLREGLEKTIGYFKEKLSREQRVAVFAPSFHPREGLQEKFVRTIIQELSDVKFDVYTMGHANTAGTEKDGNLTIYRIGSGSAWDRFRFPWRAAVAAARQEAACNYICAWGVMGSYGGFAARLFKQKIKACPIFLMIDSNEEQRSGFVRRVIRSLAKRAASYAEVFRADGTLSLDELFNKTTRDEEFKYLGYRFRQLLYRMSLEKEFGRPFLTMKRIFD